MCIGKIQGAAVAAPKKAKSDVSDDIFKRVAVVENFYDIIYNVHVEMDGRSGKHAGQKRTYRAVSFISNLTVYLATERIIERGSRRAASVQMGMLPDVPSSSSSAVRVAHTHRPISTEPNVFPVFPLHSSLCKKTLYVTLSVCKHHYSCLIWKEATHYLSTVCTE